MRWVWVTPVMGVRVTAIMGPESLNVQGLRPHERGDLDQIKLSRSRSLTA